MSNIEWEWKWEWWCFAQTMITCKKATYNDASRMVKIYVKNIYICKIFAIAIATYMAKKKSEKNNAFFVFVYF